MRRMSVDSDLPGGLSPGLAWGTVTLSSSESLWHHRRPLRTSLPSLAFAMSPPSHETVLRDSDSMICLCSDYDRYCRRSGTLKLPARL